MKLRINRNALALAHAASLETRLGLARWRGDARSMPQAAWRSQHERAMLDWLRQGGFVQDAVQTKTAASGRRSLASQRDSNEECEFTQLRIRDAAA